MRSATSRSMASALALALAAAVLPSVMPATPPAAAVTGSSSYHPFGPVRFADTRQSDCGCFRSGPNAIEVRIGGARGVPQSATAVAVTLTVTATKARGYLAAFPVGAAAPKVSNINWTAGQTRANSAIVPIGTDGWIAVATSSDAEIIVDVNGYFGPTAAAKAGRYTPTAMLRIFDTRRPPATKVTTGHTVTVKMPTAVPADAIAVAATITYTGTVKPGYLSAYPTGAKRPRTSVVNLDKGGQSRSVGVIVPVAKARAGFTIYASATGHVYVDLLGYFTGGSAAKTSTGLFVPMAPKRLIDTRQSGVPLFPSGALPVGAAPALAGAFNVTVTDSFGEGYSVAYPGTTTRPQVRTLSNARAGDTASDFAITALSTKGLDVFSAAGGHLVVDQFGYFIGSPRAATGPSPVNAPPVNSKWDPLRAVTSPNVGAQCANGLSPTALSGFLASAPVGVEGADYQRSYRLPDGRVLWSFQDGFIRTGVDAVTGKVNTRLIHNLGMVQSGRCFSLLRSGTPAKPASWLLSGSTTQFKQWFWPLGGAMGADGTFKMFMVQMNEKGASYLKHPVPQAVWIVSVRLSDLRAVDVRKSPSSSSALYGFSITEDASWSYLYSHCYRQFGWTDGSFPDLGYDPACMDDVKIARVPKGRFDLVPTYWNGSTWGSSQAAAVSIIPRGVRKVNPTQVIWTGTRFVAVTKEGDWWGGRVYFDTARRPEGPWTTYASVGEPLKCAKSTCNTYFASWVPWRTGSSLTWGISHNRWDGALTSIYRPTFYAASPP